MLSSILHERAADIHDFIKASFFVASNKALVPSCIDQFSLTDFLLSHGSPFDVKPDVAIAKAKVFANRFTGLALIASTIPQSNHDTDRELSG